MMQITAIITDLRVQDVLDIVFLTIIAYHLYIWFRGTKAFKALIGLMALGVVFTLASTWGLFMTTWVFQILWQVLIILLIILFQSEIRQALERFNPLRTFGLHKHFSPEKWVSDLSDGVFELARRRIGAIIVIERGDWVGEWITGGHVLESDPTKEFLISIFNKESPLHDGAVLIKGGHITRVGTYLPLSSAEGLPKEWGTRHRAAMGLAENCDAWVIVVSEQRGEVTLMRDSQSIRTENPQKLEELISEAITPPTPVKESYAERVRYLLFNRWRAKGGTLLLVAIVWLLLAGQQNFETWVSVPLEIRNLPPQMEIVSPLNPRIRIRVRGLRKDASILTERNVAAEMDLSMARRGVTAFPVVRDLVKLPNDRIDIVNIEPSQIRFRFKSKTE